ncbi:MAG: hypothetical protein J1D87_02705 [Lachnospiraceae bacterium]|nr:hypothetical protein [Lachnospiraceae bacterium]
MSVQERLRMCQLIDQMESKEELCKRLGLENKSTFHGYPIDEYLGNKRVNEKSNY